MCFVNPTAFSRNARLNQMPMALNKGMGILGMKIFGGRPGQLLNNESEWINANSLFRFALSQHISCALIGMSSMRQLKENLSVAQMFNPMNIGEINSLEEQVNKYFSDWKK